MPFVGNHVNDVGVEIAEGPVCKFDSENGAVKSGEAIFVGGVEFFAGKMVSGLIIRYADALWGAHPVFRHRTRSST